MSLNISVFTRLSSDDNKRHVTTSPIRQPFTQRMRGCALDQPEFPYSNQQERVLARRVSLSPASSFADERAQVFANESVTHRAELREFAAKEN
jgi:hypothetical protein